MSVYGYCWTCGAPVVSRTRGIPSIDTCENGHKNDASLTLSQKQRDAMFNDERNVAATLEPLLVPIVLEQSCGEWTDDTVKADARMIAGRLAPAVLKMVKEGVPSAQH